MLGIQQEGGCISQNSLSHRRKKRGKFQGDVEDRYTCETEF